jgi:hypothetical protein
VIELHHGEISLGNHSGKTTGGEVEILLNQAFEDLDERGTRAAA